MLWFRGHRCEAWPLLPSAFRRGAVLESQTAIRFRERAGAYLSERPEREDCLSWLLLMQHYGLPTRLLDWSESLLCAAYFAVSHEERREPAAIWALVPAKLSEVHGLGAVIPIHASRDVQLLAKAAFELNSVPIEAFALPLQPAHIDLRMACQKSVFTVHGDRLDLAELDIAGKALMKLVIENEDVDSIRSDVSVLGASRTTYFPDIFALAHELSDWVEIK